jgi:hypothetical protein
VRRCVGLENPMDHQHIYIAGPWLTQIDRANSEP